MQLDIVSFSDLIEKNPSIVDTVNIALHDKGIIGVRGVPGFIEKSAQFIAAARQFSALDERLKTQYTPDRSIGRTEGYELGAEKFLNDSGEWVVDDKKASYYAFVPDDIRNKWPKEMNLKTPYLALSQLIFQTGKKLLDLIGINQGVGICHELMTGYGRMLHYQKVAQTTPLSPNWCGAHFDHGVFTGLMPAYYFKDGIEVDEPKDAGLYIKPTHGKDFAKVAATDKTVIYFQVGEFAQLATHDRIRATEHLVRKSAENIERFTLAVFYGAADNATIQSRSVLSRDKRYANQIDANGKVNYLAWQDASYARYHAQ